MLIVLFVAFLVIVVNISIAFFAIMRKNRTAASDDFPSISFDSQNLYRPIRSLRNSIRATIETSDDPAVQAMAGGVLQEVNDAHDRVVQALQTRDDLRKAIESHSTAKSEADRFLKQRELAESDEEKLALTKAFEAKIAELAEYDRAKGLIEKIEHEIELTKVSLIELKSKLTVSDALAATAGRTDDLRTTLGNLETIQSSVDEAKEMLRP